MLLKFLQTEKPLGNPLFSLLLLLTHTELVLKIVTCSESEEFGQKHLPGFFFQAE